MKKLFALLLIPSISQAVSVTSAPYPAASSPQPTHCGVFVDSAAKVEIPITIDATGKYCKYDISTISTGSHTIKMTHIAKDTVWGNLESTESNPLVLVRPGAPSTPTGLSAYP